MIKNNEVSTRNEVTVENFQFTAPGFIPLPDGWREYHPVSVMQDGGALITEGEFSALQVWMPSTIVRVSPQQTVQVPNPAQPWPPKSTFTYPNAPQFAMVVVQCPNGLPHPGSNVEVEYTTILPTATSEERCQTIRLDGSKNVFIAFNDLAGAYYDNGGNVRVMVKLIP